MFKNETPPHSRIPGWLKTSVAVIVSFSILYYYFADQDWNELYKAAMNANLTLAILSILIPQIIFWFMEVIVVDRHFSWFHAPFPLREYFWVRGAMYLILLVNNTLGGGGIVIYLQRKVQITWTKFWGIMVFRMGLTIGGIAICFIPATFAMHYYGIFEATTFNPYIWWGFIIFIVVGVIDVWLVFFHDKSYGVTRFIIRDKESELWTACRLATKPQWFITFFLTLTPILIMVVGFWFFALSFGVKIPILYFLVTHLMVLAIADMPIAFAGFGTTTMAWMIFYKDFGDQASLAGLTLFLPFARAAIRAMIGLVALKPAINDINSLLKPSKPENTTLPARNLSVEETGSK